MALHKESTCNAGEMGSIHGSGRSPGEGNGYLFLENPRMEEPGRLQSVGFPGIGSHFLLQGHPYGHIMCCAVLNCSIISDSL